MKKSAIIIVIFLGIMSTGNAQRNFSLGAGYIGSSLPSPGFLVEAEYEKLHSELFSIPVQFRAGYHPDSEGNDLFFMELHRGYRKSYQNGLFLEQSFGAGVMLSLYKEYPYYEAKNGNSGFFPNGRGWDFVPSVTLGAGYHINYNDGGSGKIWLRPKVFWKLPLSQPSQPKFALQAGYTHTISSKR